MTRRRKVIVAVATTVWLALLLADVRMDAAYQEQSLYDMPIPSYWFLRWFREFQVILHMWTVAVTALWLWYGVAGRSRATGRSATAQGEADQAVTREPSRAEINAMALFSSFWLVPAAFWWFCGLKAAERDMFGAPIHSFPFACVQTQFGAVTLVCLALTALGWSVAGARLVWRRRQPVA